MHRSNRAAIKLLQQKPRLSSCFARRKFEKFFSGQNHGYRTYLILVRTLAKLGRFRASHSAIFARKICVGSGDEHQSQFSKVSIYVCRRGKNLYRLSRVFATRGNSRDNGPNSRDGARSTGSSDKSMTRHRCRFQKTRQLLNVVNAC